MTYLIKDPEENRGISSHLPKVIFSGGEYESSCAQLENLFKLGCFGAGNAWLKFRAPPCQIPDFSGSLCILRFPLYFVIQRVSFMDSQDIAIKRNELIAEITQFFIACLSVLIISMHRIGWRALMVFQAPRTTSSSIPSTSIFIKSQRSSNKSSIATILTRFVFFS